MSNVIKSTAGTLGKTFSTGSLINRVLSVAGGRSLCAALAFVVAGVIAAPVSVYAQAQEPTARTGCVVGEPDNFVALKSFGPLNEFSFPAYY
ncbi:MAG: hypothetical protein HRT46_06015, partial [Deltaproteobacteria bacterium]|nr:hypothetical protein [Deltaproteobacteria bacterium]